MRIAEHTLETTADPKAAWALWASVTVWPEWAEGVSAARLEGPFAPGGRIYLEWDGAPLILSLERMDLGHAFAARTRSFLTTFTLQARVDPCPMGARLNVTLEAEGLGARLWARRLSRRAGAGLATSLRCLARLASCPSATAHA